MSFSFSINQIDVITTWWRSCGRLMINQQAKWNWTKRNGTEWNETNNDKKATLFNANFDTTYTNAHPKIQLQWLSPILLAKFPCNHTNTHTHSSSLVSNQVYYCLYYAVYSMRAHKIQYHRQINIHTQNDLP